MADISFSQYFLKSIKESKFDQIKLEDHVKSFIEWKKFNIIPYIPFKVDKSSSQDDQGKVFKPYARNQYRHCHCGFKLNGDPLIVYRVLNDGTIRIICVTTHDEMFNKNKRDNFIKKYNNEFPR